MGKLSTFTKYDELKYVQSKDIPYATFTGINAPDDWFLRANPLPLLDLVGDTDDILQVKACVRKGYSTTVIQGPPGTGKTTTLVSLISQLMPLANRIGVVTVAHTANAKVCEDWCAANPKNPLSLSGTSYKLYQKKDEIRDSVKARVTPTKKMVPQENGILDFRVCASIMHYLDKGGEELKKLPVYDILIIDEAGQIPIFTLAAFATLAKWIIILGDDMQLEPITAGEHSTVLDSGISAITWFKKYFPERCVALRTTYRLNAEICQLISKNYYSDIKHGLIPAETNKHTRLIGYKSVNWMDVPAGTSSKRNLNSAKGIQALVHELIGQEYEYREGGVVKTGVLLPKDIAVLAPYNLQIETLRGLLHADVTVGTVDKMQGQSVQVVIYDMTTNCALYARDVAEWLFVPARWNVALSRAKAAVFIFGSKEMLRNCRPCSSTGLSYLKKVEGLVT